MAVKEHASRPATSELWYEVHWDSINYHSKTNRVPATAYHRSLDSSTGNPGPPYRSGGAFMTTKREVDEQKVHMSGKGSGSNPERWSGYYVASIGNSLPLPPTEITPSLIAAGGSGWNKFRPDGPEASVGQMLGEMRELGLPHSVPRAKDALEGMRDIADVHLKVQFGLAPLISDLKKIYSLTRRVNQRLHQLRRDNGNRVRRGGTVANIANTVTTTTLNTAPLGYAGAIISHPQFGNGRRTVSVTTYEKYWFEACFTYYVAKPNSWMWNAKAVAALYGLTPSVSTLWELTPWSWLFDWWTNTGDILGNMSAGAADSMVAEYAFAMGNKGTHTIAVHEGLVSPTFRSIDAKLITPKTYILSDVKSRVGASPYGFGLKPGDLSPRQLSILGALGISRVF